MLEEELQHETAKWLDRLKNEKERVEVLNSKGQEFMDNIEAYISDTGYFLDKGDLIRAFECVVWAWAWLEIGVEMELFQKF
ncbi:MAG: DUF357 domain-containing protein [Archaeoglobaceae archaeon]